MRGIKGVEREERMVGWRRVVVEDEEDLGRCRMAVGTNESGMCHQVRDMHDDDHLFPIEVQAPSNLSGIVRIILEDTN